MNDTITRTGINKNCRLFCIVLLMVLPDFATAITLEEALNLAKETLPAYKAATLKVSASEALATASLGPYLPSIDAAASRVRHSVDLNPIYRTKDYQLSTSLTLFDGGRRHANRHIALLTLDVASEDLRKALIDLEYNVKVAFYIALANRDLLEQKKIQLEDAQKDYEVAQGRYKFGLVKLSDTLQASVRLEQAKYNVITADGEFRKAFADLNSLTGSAFNAKHSLEGSLDYSGYLPDIRSLYEAALKKPEIKQAIDTVKIAQFNNSLDWSAFWPTVSINAAYARAWVTPGDITIPDEKTIGLSLSWNIFEFGKYYRQKSSTITTNVSETTLKETMRTLLLDLQKTYDDFVTATNKISVAQEQLKQTEHNYIQAFGEYKIGKADILSLVQAESQLADARTQLIRTKQDILVAKSQLEQVAGVHLLETLLPGSGGDKGSP